MKNNAQREIPSVPPERPVPSPSPPPVKIPETPVLPPEIIPYPDIPSTPPSKPSGIFRD